MPDHAAALEEVLQQSLAIRAVAERFRDEYFDQANAAWTARPSSPRPIYEYPPLLLASAAIRNLAASLTLGLCTLVIKLAGMIDRMPDYCLQGCLDFQHIAGGLQIRNPILGKYSVRRCLLAPGLLRSRLSLDRLRRKIDLDGRSFRQFHGG